MIRLFVALLLPDDILEAIFGIHQDIPGIRWTSMENLHLTLRFIGEVPPSALEELTETLSEIQTRSFRLSLRGIQPMPEIKPPRMLWLRVVAEKPLMELKSRVDGRIEKLKLKNDRLPPFKPHITLARMRGVPCKRLAQYLTSYAEFQTQPFVVDAFHLFSSRLTSSGPVYEAIAVYPFIDVGPLPPA